LWRNIPLEPAALAVVDSPDFQRLRYVRQLGHAFLVYPGATHTRFEHALGAYHLASRALERLGSHGWLEGLDETDLRSIRLTALLHDIGHYPFSHALEEDGFPSHEELGETRLSCPPLADLLRSTGDSDPARSMGELIRGKSPHPLAGLISGPIDVDKLDYLRRDSLMCGVPYGEVDVDRLLACLAVVELDGHRTIGVLEKGLAALESLLFAKYQMYRNVYWHHAVRSATAMFKRLVREAVAAGTLQPARLAEATDDWLMHDLASRDPTGLAAALRERQLYKRALELTPGELGGAVPEWVHCDPHRLGGAEDELARRSGLAAGELLIDYPRKEAMLGVDLPILLRGGRVERLKGRGWPGRMDLPRLADSLAESACRLRVLVRRPATITGEMLFEALSGAG
jgi:hypothetical protein